MFRPEVCEPAFLSATYGGTAPQWMDVVEEIERSGVESDLSAMHTWVHDERNGDPLFPSGERGPDVEVNAARVLFLLGAYRPARVMVALLLLTTGCTAAQGADDPPCAGGSAPVHVELTQAGAPCVRAAQGDPATWGDVAYAPVEVNPECCPVGYVVAGVIGGTLGDAVVCVVPL